jgi:hypothetical protein
LAERKPYEKYIYFINSYCPQEEKREGVEPSLCEYIKKIMQK